MATALLSLGGACWAQGPALEWIRKLGSGGDTVAGMSPDGLGGVYLAGETWGSLAAPNAGGGDVYLAKYSTTGDPLWVSQFGTASRDRTLSMAANGLGNVFHSAITSGPPASPSLKNYDANGSERWSVRPAGIAGSGVSADGAGNVYLTGTIGRPAPDDDGVLEKYDSAGNLLWSRQFGTSDHEQGLVVSADSAGNVFTYGQSVKSDTNRYTPSATLTKFDADGNEYWTRIVESARYVNRGGVAADGLGNVYITGNSNAPIIEPRVHIGYDAFVAKYDAAGNRLWLQEFGTAEFADNARGVAVDGRGNVFVVGTMGDPFLANFDGDGNQIWTYQFGAPEFDSASFVSVDRAGHVYVAGRTTGDPGGPNAGGYEIFLAKFNVNVPEPTTGRLLLIAIGLGGILWRASHRPALRSTSARPL
jgi:hypothetical protein